MGAEHISHSLQHSLTDKHAQSALLKLDISNAFSTRATERVCCASCTARRSSARCTGWRTSATRSPASCCCRAAREHSISSSNGVRQGDPLSAVLFCLYLRDVLARVAASANVRVYAFFDDLNVEGSPAEVMKALAPLQHELPAISLTVNSSKSHFAHFHGDEAPLPRSMLQTLADHDNERHHGRHSRRSCCTRCMGAVVGCDEGAIREGLDEMIAGGRGRDAFLSREQGVDERTCWKCELRLLRSEMGYRIRCTHVCGNELEMEQTVVVLRSQPLSSP